jgi:hypothetical protein
MARLCCTGARGRLWPGIRIGARGVPARELTGGELCELTGGGLCETGGFGGGRGGEELCDGGGGALRLL